MIWRDAGRAVNGSGMTPVRAGDPRADVGQAGAALARAETRLARALEEFELGEAAIPGGAEVGDGRAHAAADDALGRGRGEWQVGGRVADDGDRHRPGHPGEDVAGREAEPDDDGVGRRGGLGAGRGVRGDDGADASRGAVGALGVTFESNQPPDDRRRPRPGGRRTDGHHTPEVHARVMQPFGGPGGHDPGQPVARADRMDLGGAGRDDDLVRMDVEHPARSPDDDHRSGVDRHDLLAGPGIQDADRAPGTLGVRGRGSPARPAADDRNVDLEVVELGRRRERGRGEIRGGHHGECRHRPGRMPRNAQPRRRRGLARPDVRDAIDLGEAVPAIPGQAQRPAAPRDLPTAQDRHRHRIARLERHRPPVDDDPARHAPRRRPSAAAGATSVTGASANPAGRTTAPAGAGPAGAAR